MSKFPKQLHTKKLAMFVENLLKGIFGLHLYLSGATITF